MEIVEIIYYLNRFKAVTFIGNLDKYPKRIRNQTDVDF